MVAPRTLTLPQSSDKVIVLQSTHVKAMGRLGRWRSGGLHLLTSKSAIQQSWYIDTGGPFFVQLVDGIIQTAGSASFPADVVLRAASEFWSVGQLRAWGRAEGMFGF